MNSLRIVDGKLSCILPIRTRYAETDMMQYIHHSVYPVYFEAARTELLRHIGISYRQMEEQGILLPVMEMSVKFYHPAFYDDLLEVEAVYSPQYRAVLELQYYVWKDGTCIAEGKTSHLFVDGRTRKAIKPPQFFWDAVNKYRGANIAMPTFK